MGKAIIIPDISFGSTPLGRVSISGLIPIRAINIDAPSTFTGTTLQLIADLFPLNTTQRGVTWSIISGSAYATINANTGVLTVLSGASANNVTVKVASTDATGVEATKTIAVTYSSGGDPVPVWSVEKTYNTMGDGETVALSTTDVNLSHIAIVKISGDNINLLEDGRLFTFCESVSPYKGYNWGRIPTPNQPTQYWWGQAQGIATESNAKVAFKLIHQTSFSVTYDGVNWTDYEITDTLNPSLVNIFYGRYYTGHLKIEIYNDMTIDVASLLAED